MIKLFFVVIFFTSFFNLSSYAITGSEVQIIGFVHSFDEDNIILDSGTSRLTIPRKYYSKHVGAGHQLKIEIPAEEYKKLKPKEIPKKAASK